jgi:hypothetical protein
MSHAYSRIVSHAYSGIVENDASAVSLKDCTALVGLCGLYYHFALSTNNIHVLERAYLVVVWQNLIVPVKVYCRLPFMLYCMSQ